MLAARAHGAGGRAHGGASGAHPVAAEPVLAACVLVRADALLDRRRHHLLRLRRIDERLGCHSDQVERVEKAGRKVLGRHRAHREGARRDGSGRRALRRARAAAVEVLARLGAVRIVVDDVLVERGTKLRAQLGTQRV